MQLHWQCELVIYDREWEFCRSCFVNFRFDHIYDHMKTNNSHVKHHKWQRSECGWKCFKLRTSSLVSWWSVFISWSYVDRLGLNACKWVAWRTGMYLFHDVGWFCFVSMKQRISLHTYSSMYVNDIINTGHNEVISFDLLWTRRSIVIDLSRCRYSSTFITKLSDWSCRWLSFILKIKPCMSKYELV